MAFQFKLPDVGEGLHEAEIVRWLVTEGQVVTADQPIVEIQTDKATVEITSPVSGRVAKLHYGVGDTAKVGTFLLTIEDGRTASTPAPAPVPASASTPVAGRWIPATPSTRRLAKDLGIDVNDLSGTGPAGRVTDDDVRRAAAGGVSEQIQAPAPRPSGLRDDRRIPLKGILAVIAKRMVIAASTIPHAAAMDEVDLTALIGMRAELKASYPDQKITYLAFLVKAVAQTLPHFPYLNARLEPTEILLRGEIHIGIATATDEGLMVPVIRNADQKSILQISAEIADLSARARSRRLKPDELTDSTFTITNIGALGGLLSVPIINHPEVGILGFHKVQDRPVGRDGQIVLRPMSYLSLSFDHRVVDGDVAVGFLTHVTRYLEQPSRLVVEMI